jgi:hypothetical protein
MDIVISILSKLPVAICATALIMCIVVPLAIMWKEAYGKRDDEEGKCLTSGLT